MSYGMVFVAARDGVEGEKIARSLLDRKLAACCNIVKDVRSFYWWQGKVEDSPEVLVVIKTRQELFSNIAGEVKRLHSYEVPEIVMLPIIEGDGDYLRWIDESLQ